MRLYQEVPKAWGWGTSPPLSGWVHRQGPREWGGRDRKGQALSLLLLQLGLEFPDEGLSTCICDARSQMRSRTKLHSMNRKSPKDASKGNLEAEAIPRAEARDLSPRGFLPEERA